MISRFCRLCLLSAAGWYQNPLCSFHLPHGNRVEDENTQFWPQSGKKSFAWIVSDSDTWRKKRQQRKETKVDICIRGINSNVVKALETSAKNMIWAERNICVNAWSGLPMMTGRWEANMSSSCKSCFSVWKASKNSLVFWLREWSRLKNPVADWKMDFLKRNPGQRNRKERLYEWGKDI